MEQFVWRIDWKLKYCWLWNLYRFYCGLGGLVIKNQAKEQRTKSKEGGNNTKPQ